MRLIPKEPDAIRKMMDEVYFEGKADGLRDAVTIILQLKPLDSEVLEDLFESTVRRLGDAAEEADQKK